MTAVARPILLLDNEDAVSGSSAVVALAAQEQEPTSVDDVWAWGKDGLKV